MAYATFDESKWPIVLITFSGEEPTVAEFDSYLNKMLSIYERKQPVSFVFDSSKTKYLRSELRIKQGNWIKKHKDIIAELQKCLIFVIPNIMVRFIFDAVLAITPLYAPYATVKTVEEGLAEAARRLELAGVQVKS